MAGNGAAKPRGRRLTRRGVLALLSAGASALAASCAPAQLGRQVAAPGAPPATPVPPSPTAPAGPAATFTAVPAPTSVPATAVPATATARPAGGRVGLTAPSARALPRWSGFNLQEKFNNDWGARRFQERDFEWIAELGFNFVRLPMDYRCWAEPGNWSVLRQSVMEEFDQVMRWAEQYQIHVNLAFHRAPGYSVTPPAEPKSLWENDEAQYVCGMHWANFARRYRGVPGTLLSFNLVNEPPAIDPALYRRVASRLVDAIRKEDSQRLVIADGSSWGVTPPGELVGLNVAAATRGYEPMRLTHYQAEWIDGAAKWTAPTYTPGADRSVAQRVEIAPWRALQDKGMGVMVGEFGAYNRTPHAVTLAWMRDRLQLWRDAGWGWALWNFRGPFGVIDSGRSDVAYERWRGVQLDRAMLSLLQEFAAS